MRFSKQIWIHVTVAYRFNTFSVLQSSWFDEIICGLWWLCQITFSCTCRDARLATRSLRLQNNLDIAAFASGCSSFFHGCLGAQSKQMFKKWYEIMSQCAAFVQYPGIWAPLKILGYSAMANNLLSDDLTGRHRMSRTTAMIVNLPASNFNLKLIFQPLEQSIPYLHCRHCASMLGKRTLSALSTVGAHFGN